MNFRVTGLSPEPFRPLYDLSDEDLARRGVKRYVADASPGFPDRVTMRDAKIGENLLLLNHVCQPADTPYRASHAIFVLEGAETRYDRIGEIPDVIRFSSEGLAQSVLGPKSSSPSTSSGQAFETRPRGRSSG